MQYLNNKVIAVLVLETLDNLNNKIEHLILEGYSVIEVTLRTDCAFEAIKFIKDHHPNLKVGAGTILSSEQLQQCILHGADFGVAPGLNPKIVKQAQSQNFDFVPGIATPSELEQAMSLGIELVKVFPAKSCGGVGFIKALSGPYPKMRFMPTGGITKETFSDYLSLPAVKCVGGSWMSN
jgi:2-dehydro-3-deoxyphosphogluconate aldolase/(4S)-4-hydroxy-2-oxoglutarate aldolase